MKYRHCNGKVVLKVTDDKECLLYKTDQLSDLKKIEKLNNLFFILMTKGADAKIDDVEMATPEVAAAAPRPAGRKPRRKG
eukprot:CAMPEP_0117677248 /NCGR_PEP_ID=MMETSP0804-20121206/16643_1 /TAXON_ID=1074897 /ORGANISM="Tetraselmis astigmatica, Strain CCMP880" /LENGTH=79 /DNA_ID=CAMNT_0005486517 /DNA_START=307 /DNA_END=546 /DNA_ORIENTATION=-